MSRIASVFRRSRHKALIPYVTVGYPSVEDTLKVVPILAGSGCDMVELGIPFSDPLADGATIQKASYNALKNGVTPKLCLDVAAKLSRKVDVPLIFMTYFNPVLSYGLEKFCAACAGSGIDGLIIPDLQPDEGSTLEDTTKKHNLDLIYLLAPTSSDDRIKLVAERARGFIYLVSVTGVTGTRATLPQELKLFVNRVRKAAKQPLCVGFGISTPEQATQVAAIADGVIVGSKIIQLLETDGLTAVADFVKQLRRALDLAGK
jgi:tryptophan synthase alpha chain